MKTIAFLSTETQRLFRKSAEQAGISMNDMGYANGYVALPPDHPLHGMDYDRIYQVADISVWGGLTFSEYRRDCQHDPQWVEVITDGATFDAIPDDWWVLGFDTMHFGDGPNHDRQWCVRETRMLQLQLEAIKSIPE